jgi:hypothetical protein
MNNLSEYFGIWYGVSILKKEIREISVAQIYCTRTDWGMKKVLVSQEKTEVSMFKTSV